VKFWQAFIVAMLAADLVHIDAALHILLASAFWRAGERWLA
jgi:hypothetical protein